MDCNLAVAVYDSRLKTLKHWPFSEADGATCTAEKLAEAGFFCPDPEGDPDSVCCFVCHKELNGWEPTDSPIDEHKSHSPKCKFLKNGCKDFAKMKLKQYLDIFVKSQVEYFLVARKKQELESFAADMDSKKDKFMACVSSMGLEIDQKE